MGSKSSGLSFISAFLQGPGLFSVCQPALPISFLESTSTRGNPIRDVCRRVDHTRRAPSRADVEWHFPTFFGGRSRISRRPARQPTSEAPGAQAFTKSVQTVCGSQF
jgi:hypothetical protein